MSCGDRGAAARVLILRPWDGDDPGAGHGPWAGARPHPRCRGPGRRPRARARRGRRGRPRRISSRRRRWRSRRASPWRSSNSPTGSRADAHLRPRRSSMPRGRPSSRRSAGAGSTSCRSSSEDARRARASPAGRPVRRERRVSSASRSHSSRPRARDRSRGRAASMSSTRSRSRLSSSRASEDPFGIPPAAARRTVCVVAGRPQPATGLATAAPLVAEWLQQLVAAGVGKGRRER